MKSLFDIVLAQAAIIAKWDFDRIELNILAGLGIAALKTLELFALFYRKVKKPRYIPYQFCSFLLSFFGLLLIGPEVLQFIFREAVEVTFAVYMMLAFLSSFQFKVYAILISLCSIVFIVHNYRGVVNRQVNL